MDVRMWSKEFITEFINLYKSSPCLWRVKSPKYKDRYLRHLAYNKIARYCRQSGFSQANRDFVFKKIQSLRGSFRKELRKARERPNYTPSLWYYDLLLFTKDQEPLTESLSNNTEKQQDTEDDFIREEEEDHDSTTPSLTHVIEINAEKEELEDDDDCYTQAENETFDETSKLAEYQSGSLDEGHHSHPSKHTLQPTSKHPRQPKRFRLEPQATHLTDPLENDEDFHAACVTSKRSETEFDVWARSIAMQLNHMDTSRALNLQLQIQTLVSNERLAFESSKPGNSPW